MMEPMTMGSPASSPSSPGIHGSVQSPFLPAYLMGEPAPAASPSGRLWSASSGSSPPRTSLNKSAIMSPRLSSDSFVNSPRADQRNRDLIGGRQKEKPGAPPVAGLLETITSPNEKRVDSFHMAEKYGSPFPGTPAQQVRGTPTVFTTPQTHHDTSQIYSQAKKTPPSPAQVDPFYTQGENLGPEDILDETWVTVFGFPPAATSFVLQQFSQYGNILKHVVATDGNWMHIHYQSKLQAKKALSKNGKIFGGSVMVGVNPCIDKNIMGGESVQDSDVIRTSFICSPNQSINQSMSERLNMSQRNTPIRPLTAAYKTAASENEVINGSNTPKKNSGVIGKTMQYVFGW